MIHTLPDDELSVLRTWLADCRALAKVCHHFHNNRLLQECCAALRVQTEWRRSMAMVKSQRKRYDLVKNSVYGNPAGNPADIDANPFRGPSGYADDCPFRKDGRLFAIAKCSFGLYAETVAYIDDIDATYLRPFTFDRGQFLTLAARSGSRAQLRQAKSLWPKDILTLPPMRMFYILSKLPLDAFENFSEWILEPF